MVNIYVSFSMFSSLSSSTAAIIFISSLMQYSLCCVQSNRINNKIYNVLIEIEWKYFSIEHLLCKEEIDKEEMFFFNFHKLTFIVLMANLLAIDVLLRQSLNWIEKTFYTGE